MNQSITRLTLDVSVQEKQASISVRQFDTMRRLVFSMVDRGLPYIFEKGVYAAISVNTSPETSVFGGCVIKDGAVHFDLDKSLTLEPAEYGCDLILYASDHKVLTASSFDLIVFASNASDYASEAVLSNDFSAMVEATAEAKDAAAEAIDAARNANDAAELARDAEEDAYKATQRADEISKTLEDKLAAGEFQGDNGENGESAYEIAKRNGFDGTETEWLASLKGKDGAQGEKGEGIPPINPEDANKVLTANEDGTAGWKDPKGGLSVTEIESPDDIKADSPDGLYIQEGGSSAPSGGTTIHYFDSLEAAEAANLPEGSFVAVPSEDEVIDFTGVFDFAESIMAGGSAITKQMEITGVGAEIVEKMKKGPVKIKVAFNGMTATVFALAQGFDNYCQFTDFVVFDGHLLYMYLAFTDYDTLTFRCQEVPTAPFNPS